MKPATCVIAGVSPANHPLQVAPKGNIALDLKISPRRALVVDDELLIRWSVVETLSERGFDVEEAKDAQSALRRVTTTIMPFDIVVLDLRLPDMTDLSLLGTLRQLLPKASLILMTAFGTPDVLEQATRMGAAVLGKPFELGELHRLVGASGSLTD